MDTDRAAALPDQVVVRAVRDGAPAGSGAMLVAQPHSQGCEQEQ
jgi:hypothetical protein